jgi:hypothetical protein
MRTILGQFKWIEVRPNIPWESRGDSFACARFISERNPADLPKAAIKWRIEWL